MLTAHLVVASLVVAVTAVVALSGGVAYRRGRAAGRVLTQLVALTQTLLVAQVALGLLLLASGRRAAFHLHYLYGTLALLAVLSPWVYAPPDPRRRLLWFSVAALVALALAIRALMTGR